MFDENEHLHPQNNDEGPRHIHRGIKRSEPDEVEQTAPISSRRSLPPQSAAETNTDASVRAAEISGAAPQTVGAAAPQRARPR